MKKFISIISIILAMCIMVSCGNVSETVTNGTSDTEITTETTNAIVSTTGVTTTIENTSTAPVQTTQTSVTATTAKTEATTANVVNGCDVTVTIVDYDEYVSFITTMGMPDSFMTYEELSFLGSFKAFICPPFASAKELTQYMYDFKDSNGYDIAIDIRPVKNQISTENILMLNNVTDYRKLSSDERGVATINGLTYSYVKGSLLTIEFVYENMQFVISGNSVLSDYPVNGEDTFMSRLLSPATAKAAAAEFVTALAK